MDSDAAQSRIIRQVKKLELVSMTPEETIYRVLAETNTGPLELRFTELSLVELASWLNNHERFRGSAL